MGALLLLTDDPGGSSAVLPALSSLPYEVQVAGAEAAALLQTPPPDAVLLDARSDLVKARSTCRIIAAVTPRAPVLLVVHEGGLAALSSTWGFNDLLLVSARPAEVHLRLQLAAAAAGSSADHRLIRTGNLVVDVENFVAELDGTRLDLTYTEFELLTYLAQHPGRVFSRHQLLKDVWGYNFSAGIRTVDVHVRRLRAKLGPEHQSIIGTVRNVGYRFNAAVTEEAGAPAD